MRPGLVVRKVLGKRGLGKKKKLLKLGFAFTDCIEYKTIFAEAVAVCFGQNSESSVFFACNCCAGAKKNMDGVIARGDDRCIETAAVKGINCFSGDKDDSLVSYVVVCFF